MSSADAVLATSSGLLQPNVFDRKRLERAIDERARYRYVKPRLLPVDGGFRIESPCCSRRIDPDGGVVDIALILYHEPGVWSLYCKDHAAGAWELYDEYEMFSHLLEHLKQDPERLFWQ